MHFVEALFFMSVVTAVSGGSCNLSKSKKVAFTNYWVAIENSRDYGRDGKEITLSEPKTAPLKSCDGRLLAMTNKMFADKCSLEGTCKLADGRTLNVGENNRCFIVLNASTPWGLGNKANALIPFASVAANGLKYGTKLRITELISKTLPNGRVHNGCVRIDDTCSNCKRNCHLDIFVGLADYYKLLNTPDTVTAVIDTSCRILNYSI